MIKLIVGHIKILIIISFFSINSYSQTLLEQKQALDVISNFAEYLCKDIPIEGEENQVELSGEGKIEVLKFIQKLAGLQIEGAAKYLTTDYKGILRKDLAFALKNNLNCRLIIWGDLKDKLIIGHEDDKFEIKSSPPVNALIGILNVRSMNKYRKSKYKNSMVFSEEILLIAKVSNGKLVEIDEAEIQNKEDNGRRFTVYEEGYTIGDMNELRTEKRDFWCTELHTIVGSSTVQKDKLLKDIWQHDKIDKTINTVSYKDFAGDEITGRYVVLSKQNHLLTFQDNGRNLAISLSNAQKSKILNFIHEELSREETNEVKSEIKSIAAYDFNGDGQLEYLVAAEGVEQKYKGRKSLHVIFHIIGDRIAPLQIKTINNLESAWGNGYKFMGAIDMDGDKIAELVFEVSGYEALGYIIFKYDNNMLKEAVRTILYGC